MDNPINLKQFVNNLIFEIVNQNNLFSQTLAIDSNSIHNKDEFDCYSFPILNNANEVVLRQQLSNANDNTNSESHSIVYQFVLPKNLLSQDCNQLVKEMIDYINFHELNHYVNHKQIVLLSRSKNFIMIAINNQFIRQYAEQNYIQVKQVEAGKRLNVVVDYSSPNIAKEMHVGHIRSTVIGDSIARLYQLKNHNVLLQNHIGDFGKPIAMIVAWILINKNNIDLSKDLNLKSIKDIYVNATELSKTDEQFNAYVAHVLTVLQHIIISNEVQNDNSLEIQTIYKLICDVSLAHVQHIYDELGILLKPTHILGESFYGQFLSDIVNLLIDKNIATIDGGDNGETIIVKDLSFNNKPLPTLVIQRENGSYLYSTTDIAAALHRIKMLNADKILYVVDNRQTSHFQSIFTIVKQLQYKVDLQHIDFGTILGKDKKPFKTRQGDLVTLDSLIKESIERAKTLIIERNQNNCIFDNDNKVQVQPQSQVQAQPQSQTDVKFEIENLAKIIGIGVLKYADLSKNRSRDFIFDWDNLLSFVGDSSVYLQYTAVRINKILNDCSKQSVVDDIETLQAKLLQNKILVKQMQFNEILDFCLKEHKLNHLCDYLQDLAGLFNNLYNEQRFILDNGGISKINLNILNNMKYILDTGLTKILGIDIPIKM